jgi:hypothetical protein
MIDNTLLPSFIRSHLPTLAAIGAAAGFVSDVVTPLAPFAFYITIIVGAVVVVLVLLNRIFKSQLMSGITTVSGVIALCNGIVAAAQYVTGTANAGLSASQFEYVAELQMSLGIVQSELGDIKSSVGKIEEATSQIAKNSEKSLAVLQDIASEVSKAGTQGIIANPRNLLEFYANAKLLEASGDYVAAVIAYKESVKRSELQIDPAYSLYRLVSNREGREATRGALLEVRTESNATAVDTVFALLEEREKGIADFDRLRQINPRYLPLLYLSAGFLIDNRDSNRVPYSTAQKAFEDLTAFVSRSANPDSASQFIDLNFLLQWKSEAESKRLTLQSQARKVQPASAEARIEKKQLCFYIDTGEPITGLLLFDKLKNSYTEIADYSDADMEPVWEMIAQGSRPGVKRCAPISIDDMKARYAVSDPNQLQMWYRDVDGNLLPFAVDLPHVLNQEDDWKVSRDESSTNLAHISGLSIGRDKRTSALTLAFNYNRAISGTLDGTYFLIDFRPQECASDRRNRFYHTLEMNSFRVTLDYRSSMVTSEPIPIAGAIPFIKQLRRGNRVDKTFMPPESLLIALVLDALVNCDSIDYSVLARGDEETLNQLGLADLRGSLPRVSLEQVSNLIGED